MNGPCHYIDYSLGDDCDVEDTIQGHRKEGLMHYENKVLLPSSFTVEIILYFVPLSSTFVALYSEQDVINTAQLVPEKQEQDRIWSTVEKSEEELVEQCYKEAWPDINDLYRYWGVNEERGMHHGVGGHHHGLNGGKNWNWGQEIDSSQVTPGRAMVDSSKGGLVSNR